MSYPEIQVIGGDFTLAIRKCSFLPCSRGKHPLGVKGVVVGEGDTYEEALADVKSAI